MAYVDGFVLIVPKKNLAAYKKMAKGAGKIWKEHGALAYFEGEGDDMKVTMGLPFPKLTKAKPTDVVVFSYIVYKNKAERNKVNAKVMKDKRIHELCGGENSEMPFNVKNMAYGGFKAMVAL